MTEAPDQQREFTAEELAALSTRGATAASLWFGVAVGIAVSVGLWFIWRPLGATFALITVGYLRRFFLHRADFWSQSAALVVGLLVGVAVAVLARLLTAYSGVSWLGASWLGLLGFFAAGYIGYGTSPNAAFASMSLDRNRAT